MKASELRINNLVQSYADVITVEYVDKLLLFRISKTVLHPSQQNSFSFNAIVLELTRSPQWVQYFSGFFNWF